MVAWLKDLHRLTRGKNNHPRIVFLDGHSSHYTLELIETARECNIFLITYPPHSTHAMQGLDVTVFGVFKRNYAKMRAEWEDERGYPVTKANFLEFIAGVRAITYSEALIAAAWEKVGLHPWNPILRFTPTTFCPQAVHLSSGLLNSITADIGHLFFIKLNHTTPSGRATCGNCVQPNRRPSCCDPPSTRPHPIHPKETSCSDSSIPHPVLEAVPLHLRPDYTILNQRLPSLPSLKTVLDRVGDLEDQLEKARVENQVLTSINQGKDAQLVIQYLYVEKLRKKLFAKETNVKKSRVQHLGSAVGRHVTSDEFWGILKEAAAEKLSQEEQKQALKDLREEKKAWREQEQSRRLAINEANRNENKAEREWCQERGEKAFIRPMLKRSPTPERFAVLKRKPKGTGIVDVEVGVEVVANDDEGSEGDWEESDVESAR